MGLVSDETVFIDESGFLVFVERGNGGEFDFTAARTQAVAGELGKGEDEIRDGGGVCVEEVEVEMEGLARGESLAVEVDGAEDEGAWVIGKAAGAGGSGRRSGRFEKTRVGAGGAVFAALRALAVRETGDAAEDGAEGAAQDVGRFTFGKVNGFAGDEAEAERFKAKQQDSFYVGARRLGRVSRQFPGLEDRCLALWRGQISGLALVPGCRVNFRRWRIR